MNSQDRIETFTRAENISKWEEMAKVILFMKMEKDLNQQEVSEQDIKEKTIALNVCFPPNNLLLL